MVSSLGPVPKMTASRSCWRDPDGGQAQPRGGMHQGPSRRQRSEALGRGRSEFASRCSCFPWEGASNSNSLWLPFLICKWGQE